MTMRKRLCGMVLFAVVAAASAQQSTDYMIVKMPVAMVSGDTLVEVQWAGLSRNPLSPAYKAPDSGYIYYSKSPGGGKLANYANRVTRPWVENRDTLNNIYDASKTPVRRGTTFKPSEQKDMGAGVYYCVVALPLTNDTLVSNEFQIIVKTSKKPVIQYPSGLIKDLTPTFTWDQVPGVPYYHIILSDEPIKPDTTSGEISLTGLSIVWQAITPTNQMVYGAPDPSKIITADPPPLSPKTSYTWVVLNNYGNHPAFSQTDSYQVPPGMFTVEGTSLMRPKNVGPVSNATLSFDSNKKFSFKWTNLDSNANTYKIYVYVANDIAGMEQIEAKVTVWQKEVRADDTKDTLSVEIDAAATLTDNKYTWRVMAVDAKGAGSAGDTTSFRYDAPTGTMQIYTCENVVVNTSGRLDTVVMPVGLAKAQMEVLDGSMEAPLFFYTEPNGKLSRARPAGTYRVTMIRDGYENLTKTIVLPKGATTSDTFYLQRPESRVFGKMVDESKQGINLGEVTGISDRGDTVRTKCDGSGNFVLNCYGADWQVSFGMTGFQPVLPVKITVRPGESYNFNTVTLKKLPFTFSGVIKNGDNQPLLGVQVKILRDGVQLDQVPSTPQNGAFSFTVSAGTYRLVAEKVGFTSYSGTFDVVNSRAVSVVLKPRATLVAGFVYGKSYVNGVAVTAPITTAGLSFVAVGSTDTVLANIDGVYGNYNISLPRDKKYRVFTRAEGFVPGLGLDTVSTGSLSNIVYNDTLLAYAMIPGTVRLSSTKAAVGDVGISLVDTLGTIAATAKSTANGYFEIRNIKDGTYRISAGKDGVVLDSIQGADTLVIAGGRSADTVRTSLALFMMPGDKTVKWTVIGSASLTGRIKIQSPIVKTIAFSDTLAKSSGGNYIVSVDAADSSVLDLSSHRFVVPALASEYRDTVAMNVVRTVSDTLVPSGGKVTLTISSALSLDSAKIYFKDAGASAWAEPVAKNSAATTFSFQIEPPKDGSVLQYYFKAYRKSDVYGYDKETFFSWVVPDTTMWSKVEVVPFSADTLVFPSQGQVKFSLRGYYSSSFVRDTTVDPTAIVWKLTNAQGCSLSDSVGIVPLVKTGALTSTPVILTATIDTAKIRLKAGLSRNYQIVFRVSGRALKKISVKRVDAKGSQPITTSLADRAEFIAQGVDRNDAAVSLTPVWSIDPPIAGSISLDGVFRPDPKFIGFVRVFGTVGNLVGEYVDSSSKAASIQPGLSVQRLVAHNTVPDTARNGKGVSLVFPAGIVPEGSQALISLSVPQAQNMLNRGYGNRRMVDSNAYEIKELNDIAFDTAGRKINLVMELPGAKIVDMFLKDSTFVALWDTLTLQWKPLRNSIIAADGRSISAELSHFSRYAIVSQPSTDFRADMIISPNPFSPRVRPGNGRPLGTCIKATVAAPEQNFISLDLRIYSLTGDLVWGLEIRNGISNREYSIWWDGTTTNRIENGAAWTGDSKTYIVRGKNMCRNGRYFAVLTANGYKDKSLKLMKQIVLMK